MVFDDAQTVAVKPPQMPLRDAAAPFRREVKPLRRLVVFDFAETALGVKQPDVALRRRLAPLAAITESN